MRVKIGNKWYDSKQEPICIQVSEGEQEQIADMDRSVATSGKYAQFPDDVAEKMGREGMFEWMKD